MLSVVVIGRQSGSLLPRCLGGIAEALAEIPHEVLYVDAHSTDDSIDIARASGARVLLPDTQDSTPALGRWIGTQEARGDTLLFMDHDMRLAPGFAEAAMAAMERNGWAGATGIRADSYRADGREVGRNENYFGCTGEWEAPVFGGALLIRREALQRAGGWNPDVATCEEVELHARLRKHGARIVELPVPMIEHIDERREQRSALQVLFNRRRLGLGQAVVAAMRADSLGQLIRLEWQAFTVFAADALSLLALLYLGLRALPWLLGVQLLLFLWLYLTGQPRSYVTHTLLLLYLPAGMLSYHGRDRAYTALDEGERT